MSGRFCFIGCCIVYDLCVRAYSIIGGSPRATNIPGLSHPRVITLGYKHGDS